MTHILKLTENLCSEIETRPAASLEPLSREYGFDFKMLKGHLAAAGTTFAARCRIAVPKRQHTVAGRKEEEDCRCYAESFGMRAEWPGKAFKRGNFTYKIVGLRLHAPGECAVPERSDGARS